MRRSLCCLLLTFAASAEQRFFVKMPMRDGVRLSANVFLPKAEGRYSTLLVRTPVRERQRADTQLSRIRR